MSAKGFRRGATFWFLALVLGAAAVVRAEPVIGSISVRGLQIGGTTTLLLDGSDFGTAPRLLLPFPAKQQLKTKASDRQAAFDVTLDGNVTPGYYQLRLVTDKGVSLPVVIAVDGMPQLPLAASVEKLPAALHGSAGGSATVETKFPGKAGQKVQVEVEAQRLGSKLRPIVHLYSPKRLQLGWSWTTPALFGDARLQAILPEDGSYTVAVHDSEYAPPGPSFFRLRVGQWSFVDQVFPPVIAQNQPQAVELLGMSAPIKLDLSATPIAGVMPLSWPKEGLWSGPRPFVRVGSQPEFVEQTIPGKLQELPPGPSGVSGRLLSPFEEDRFRLPVVPGSKLRLEVFAERFGSPLDCALIVCNDKGDQLARAEDGPGTVDPVLEYTVPGNMSALVVSVMDAQGRGGPRGVYRLAVDPQTTAGKSDFRLLTPAQSISLPVGGRSVVPVQMQRRGYMGAVALAAARLPAGVKLEGAVIPDGADGALVTVQRGASSPDAAILHWRGKAANGKERSVVIKGHPLERLQPWLATEIALAPTTNKAADFQVDWRGLAIDAGLVPSRKMVLPVKVTRPDAKSPVRFTLLTSQLPTLVNNQPDPNQTIRLEKAEELAPKTAEGNLSVFVPVDLPAPVYDVTIQGELLTPDKRAVLAVAYAPVRRMAVRSPLVVRLDGPARLEWVLDRKKETVVKIQGQVGRLAELKIQGQVGQLEGLKGNVSIVFEGLPPRARVGTYTRKTGATAFALDLGLSPDVPPGEFKVLVSADAVLDPKQPNVRVRSHKVELTLVIKPAVK